jgi:competence protein ComEA
VSEEAEMNATIERTPPTPAARTAGAAGGPTRAPGRRPGAAVDEVIASRSVWVPVLTKAAGIFAGMLALAGIGAASIASGTGVPVSVAAAAPSTASPAAPAVPPSAKRDAPAAPSPSAPAPPQAPAGSPGLAPDGRVILNLASATELTRLPRVGPKRAEAILALRARLGKFRKATDLLRVKGIGKKTLDAMLPLLVVDAPKVAGAAPEEGPPK